MGVRRCLDFFGLSLHPLQNFELMSSETLTRLHKSTGSPEPSLITFVVLDPVIKKKMHVHCVEVLHVAHADVCSLDLIVARRK